MRPSLESRSFSAAPKLKLQACVVEATSDDEEEEEKRMMGILLRIKQAKMVLEESRMRKSSQMVQTRQ